MEQKPQDMIIQVTATTQDEAVQKAQEEATKRGYKTASIKQIVSITYEALLINPVEEKSRETGEPTENNTEGTDNQTTEENKS